MLHRALLRRLLHRSAARVLRRAARLVGGGGFVNGVARLDPRRNPARAGLYAREFVGVAGNGIASRSMRSICATANGAAVAVHEGLAVFAQHELARVIAGVVGMGRSRHALSVTSVTEVFRFRATTDPAVDRRQTPRHR